MLASILAVAVTSGLIQDAAPQARVRAAVDSALAFVERGVGMSRLDSLSQRSTPGDAAFDVRLGLLHIATLQRLTYRYGDAERTYLRILEGPEDAATARAWLGYADVGLRRGELAETFERLSRAREVARREGTGSEGAEATALMSLAALRLGRRAEAFELMDHAGSIVPAWDLEGQARVRCLRSSLGLFGSEEELVSQIDSAVALARVAGARRLEAQCLANRGALLATRGALDQARVDLETAAAQQRAVHDEAGAAGALQWLGFVLRSTGRYGEAIEVLQTAIELGVLSENVSAVSWARLNLGALWSGLGDLERAHAELLDAAEAFRTTGDEWGRHSSMLLQSEILTRLGDLPGALDVALAIEEWARGMGSHLDRHAAVYLREQVHRIRGEPTDALAALAEREGLIAAHQLDGWGWSISYGRGVIALAAGEAEEALSWLDRARSTLEPDQGAFRFTVEARRAEALARAGLANEAGHALAEALERFERWRASLPSSELRALAFQGSADDADPDLGFATVVAAVAESDPALAFDLAERRRARELESRVTKLSALAAGGNGTGAQAPRAVPLSAVQSVLASTGAAAISYVIGRGGEPTTALVATATDILAVPLAPIEHLEGTIARATQLLQAGHPGSAAALSELHAALVAPVLGGLGPDITRLVLIPEGALFHVPFAALLDPDGGRLVERFALGIVPSAAILVQLRNRPPRDTPATLLAMADPDLDLPPLASAGFTERFHASRAELARLPGARREARNAARYAPQSDVYVGKRATETALRQDDLASYRVVHLATHALVDDASPVLTAIVLSATPDEDGYLSPAEITGLTLGADLVVLSACRTARGPVFGGEGLQGLAAPILGAGARSLVATSWNIDDRATARFMRDFYRALADGLPVVDALAVGQRRAIKRGDSPELWAGFVLLGDPLAEPGLVHPPMVPLGWWLAGFVILAWLSLRRAAGGRRQGAENSNRPSADRSVTPGPTASTHHA